MTNYEKSGLLLVDPDISILRPLIDGLCAQGFLVRTASTVSKAMVIIDDDPPPYGIFALSIGEDSGLRLLDILMRQRPEARVVIITMYGNIPSAVAAMKMGAMDFKLKPVVVDDVVAALLQDAGSDTAVAVDPDMLRTEYIRQLYLLNGNNITRTAKLLGVHRRSLQRLLKRLGNEG